MVAAYIRKFQPIMWPLDVLNHLAYYIKLFRIFNVRNETFSIDDVLDQMKFFY